MATQAPAPIPSFGYAAGDYQALPFAFEMTRIEQRGGTEARRPFAHRHAYLHVLWITRGEGVHAIDFEDHPLRDHSVFFIRPQQVHCWQSDVPVSGYSLKLSREFMDRVAGRSDALLEYPFGSDNPAPAAYLTHDQAHALAPLLEQLLDEAGRKERWHLDMVAGLLQQVLVQVRRLAQPGEQSDRPGSQAVLVRAFRKMLEMHYLSVTTTQDYAAMLDVSPSRLSRAARHATGRTVSQLAQDRLLLEAKRQLMFSAQPIASLASQLGFDDPAYFARFFRKHAGHAPGEFRRIHQPPG